VRFSHPALEYHNSSQHVIQEAVDGGPLQRHTNLLLQYASASLAVFVTTARRQSNSGPPDILYVSNHMHFNEWCERLDIGTLSNGTRSQHCKWNLRIIPALEERSSASTSLPSQTASPNTPLSCMHRTRYCISTCRLAP
jgi:hypothetical protein